MESKAIFLLIDCDGDVVCSYEDKKIANYQASQNDCTVEPVQLYLN